VWRLAWAELRPEPDAASRGSVARSFQIQVVFRNRTIGLYSTPAACRSNRPPSLQLQRKVKVFTLPKSGADKGEWDGKCIWKMV